jgi:hypothetical protein
VTVTTFAWPSANESDGQANVVTVTKVGRCGAGPNESTLVGRRTAVLL